MKNNVYKNISFKDKFPNVLEKSSGVYEIYFEKYIYVGSSKNVYGRLSVHRSWLRSGKHTSSLLQSKYDLVGEENIVVKIYKLKEGILDLEENLTEKHMRLGFSLNQQLGNKGRVVSKETRQKLSKLSKGRVMSDKQKLDISNTLTGHHVSLETRLKIKNSLKKYYE